MIKKLLSVIALSLIAIPELSSAAIVGFLGDFDAINDTGKTAHGFEIDLEGLHATDITSTFAGKGRWLPGGRGFKPSISVERYGAPKITEYHNATTFGVKIIYQGIHSNAGWDYGTPSGHIVTSGDQCWTGSGMDYDASTPCDHFGVGVAKKPTKTIYSWLVETSTAGELAKKATQLKDGRETRLSCLYICNHLFDIANNPSTF